MKNLIAFSIKVLLVLLLVATVIGCAQRPQVTPEPVPSPGITIPPPPENEPTPEPEPAPPPSPTPAPLPTPAPPRGPICTDPEKTISTSVGEGFTIGLRVVLRLGARWQVSYDDGMLTPEIQDLYIDDNPANPGLGGTQYFRFGALKAGATQIECSLKHGTTGPIREQKTFNVEIE